MKHCNKFRWLIGILSLAAVVAATVAAVVVYLEKKKKDEALLRLLYPVIYKNNASRYYAYSHLFFILYPMVLRIMLQYNQKILLLQFRLRQL